MSHYTVNFEKTESSGYSTWELEAVTLDEARQLAQDFVDDGEADRATITPQSGTFYEEYDGDWS